MDLEKRLAMHISKITAKKSSPVADMAAAVVQAAVQEQQQQLTQQHLALAVQAVQNSSNGVLVSEFFLLLFGFCIPETQLLNILKFPEQFSD